MKELLEKYSIFHSLLALCICIRLLLAHPYEHVKNAFWRVSGILFECGRRGIVQAKWKFCIQASVSNKWYRDVLPEQKDNMHIDNFLSPGTE